VQLAVIFALIIFADNAVEIFGPIFASWMTAKENAAFDSQGKEIQKTRPEQELDLAPYESTFEDWDELMLQYGYVLLFLVAFPLGPLMALANNFIEIRLDAGKLSRFCRRPVPHGASSIGTWYDIWQAISFLSVITNLLLCIFFTGIIDQAAELYSPDSFHKLVVKLWIFIIIEHLVFIVKFALAYLVEDEPLIMRQHLARQEYLVDVLINGQEEEEEQEHQMKKLNEELQHLKGFTFDEVPNKPDDKAIAYAPNGSPLEAKAAFGEVIGRSNMVPAQN